VQCGQKKARLAARPVRISRVLRADYFEGVVEVPDGALVPLVLEPFVPPGPVPAFFSQPTLNSPMLQTMSNAQIFFITTPFLNVVGETRFAGPSCTLSTS
jgi:hypothetical protein